MLAWKEERGEGGKAPRVHRVPYLGRSLEKSGAANPQAGAKQSSVHKLADSVLVALSEGEGNERLDVESGKRVAHGRGVHNILPLLLVERVRQTLHVCGTAVCSDVGWSHAAAVGQHSPGAASQTYRLVEEPWQVFRARRFHDECESALVGNGDRAA